MMDHSHFDSSDLGDAVDESIGTVTGRAPREHQPALQGMPPLNGATFTGRFSSRNPNLIEVDRLSEPDHLKSLGSAGTRYDYDRVRPDLLEWFKNPMPRSDATVKIVAPEFTSLCPLTGQPDFATIRISYQPRERCVESKSLKLYLGSYRQVGEFHEACAARITEDLIELLDPDTLDVTCEFTPRGGIPFWPTISYYRPGRVIFGSWCTPDADNYDLMTVAVPDDYEPESCQEGTQMLLKADDGHVIGVVTVLAATVTNPHRYEGIPTRVKMLYVFGA